MQYMRNPPMTKTDRDTLRSLHAVSYTHLDVYKRQAQWAIENELMTLRSSEHPDKFDPHVPVSTVKAIRAWKKAQQMKPVSYTHLDVYKRQAMGLSTAARSAPPAAITAAGLLLFAPRPICQVAKAP